MSNDPTKVRLLEAAGQEFAEKGYDGATVRAICDRAGMNLAAVNYHFGDKEHLYDQAVLHAHRCGPAQFETDPPVLSPDQAFRDHIHLFLSHVVAPHHSTWHQVLLLREMINPTGASDTLVREAIRPRFEYLTGLIRKLCPEVDERRVQAIAFSVVGQCLHYKLTRRISSMLVGPEAFDELDLDYLTDHISRFTLAALGHEQPFGTKSTVDGGGLSQKGKVR